MTKVEEQLTKLPTKTSLNNMSKIENKHLPYPVKLSLRQIANVMSVVDLNIDLLVDAVILRFLVQQNTALFSTFLLRSFVRPSVTGVTYQLFSIF